MENTSSRASAAPVARAGAASANTQAHTGAREAEGRDATRTTQWYVGRWGPRAD